jgi:hypothetical protein
VIGQGAQGIGSNSVVLGNTSIITTVLRGNVGIGTTTPAEHLTVAGTIQATNLLGGATTLSTDANGNIIRTPSDAKLKTNVTSVTGALDSILALRGVRYEWIDKKRFGDQMELGFVAQEVDAVLPELVRKGGEYWTLNTPNMLAVVVEAIQEMWEVVRGNQRRIAELEARLQALETAITSTTPSSGTTNIIIVGEPEITGGDSEEGGVSDADDEFPEEIPEGATDDTEID